MGKQGAIVVIGSANMDVVMHVDRLPHPGETITGGDMALFAGGKGANQACAAGKLGGSVTFIGQVGSDPFGAVLLASLRQAGVDTGCVGIAGRASGCASIYILAGGENAIVISPGANATLDPQTALARLEALDGVALVLLQTRDSHRDRRRRTGVGPFAWSGHDPRSRTCPAAIGIVVAPSRFPDTQPVRGRHAARHGLRGNPRVCRRRGSRRRVACARTLVGDREARLHRLPGGNSPGAHSHSGLSGCRRRYHGRRRRLQRRFGRRFGGEPAGRGGRRFCQCGWRHCRNAKWGTSFAALPRRSEPFSRARGRPPELLRTGNAMFVVNSLGLATLFCVVTMLGWGSWANTQKLAGKDRWAFPLYYWDYALGVFLLGLVFMLTLGNRGSAGMGAFDNLAQAAPAPVAHALLSGALFNLSNILLVVAIGAAGMAVAFPIGVGLALVIGTILSYMQAPKGNPGLLFAGVALVVFAMAMSALAYRKLARPAGHGWSRGVVFAVLAGCLMGFFCPQLSASLSPGFNSAPIRPGLLTPYTALALFGVGLLASNVVLNTVFMRAGGLGYRAYSRHAAAPFPRCSGRDDLDAGPRPEPDCLRGGGPGCLVRSRAGRNAGGGHLGCRHLA